MTESTPPSDQNSVRRANRSILLIILLAGTLFGVFTEIGMSDGVALCLMTVVVLFALHYLLKGTADSPIALLKRRREVSLPVAASVAVLLLVMCEGLLTFTAAFMPRLHDVLALAQFTVGSAWEMIPLILGAVVFAPFYEELVFRGLALRAYRDNRSTLFAVLLTSAVFGFMHGSIVQGIVFFPFGVVLALVMLKTGQLWTVFLAHALYNLAGVLLMQLEIIQLPATPVFGVLGLVVAGIVFWVSAYWLELPLTISRQSDRPKNQSGNIWTTSLVITLIVAAVSIVATTYMALEPGVGTAL